MPRPPPLEGLVLTAHHHVGVALETLSPLRGDGRKKVEGVILKLQGAMAELEDATRQAKT